MTDTLDFADGFSLFGIYHETVSSPVVRTEPITEEQQRQFLLRMRKVKLEEVDIIERYLGIDPRTAQIRAAYKDAVEKK